MFQIKRSAVEPNPSNLNSNTALPNNYGNIRTLKDDLANLKSGKKENFEEPLPQPPTPEPPVANFASKPAIAPQQPDNRQRALVSDPSFLPKQHPAGAAAEGKKNDIPNPFGSESFFQTQSPFEEKSEIPKTETKQAPAKSSHKLFTILLSLLTLAILGGGFSYWWFFMKSPKNENAPAAPTLLETAAPGEIAENNNLKSWVLDLDADKITNKLAIERYAKNISGSSPQGKAVEAKLISTNNQPIAPQTFSEIFDFTFPASVSEKITSEYSLFISQENGDPRLGAAFKLTQSGNIAESLKSEEKDFFAYLKSFYLNQTPADDPATFSSSRYKNADIRYLNFPSPTNTSLDYTILSGQENSYFIFSTSKNSLRAILDYMSEK